MRCPVKILLLGVIPAIPLLVGCGQSGSGKHLAEIASYIQESPRKALDSLSVIDTISLCRRAEKAQYSLLYTMALDKNYIDTADVSILMPALKYYRNHGSQTERIQTRFYLGRIQYNSGDYYSAIISFEEANVLAQKAGDLFWSAMAASWIGYTYNKNNCTEEEIRSQQTALNLWQEYGDSLRIMNALANLAIAYHNNYQLDEADSLLNVILDGYKATPDVYIQFADNEIKRSEPDAARVLAMFEKAIADGSDLRVVDYYEYAYALALAGQQAASCDLLLQLESFPEDASSCFWRARIANLYGDYKNESEMLRKQEEYSVSHIKDLLSQSVFKAERDHYRMMSDLADQKKRSAYLWLVIIIFAAVIVVGSLVSRSRNRRNEMLKKAERACAAAEESERMVQLAQMELNDRQSRLEEAEDRLFRLRKSFASSYRKQFEEIARSFDYCNTEQFNKESRSNDIYYNRMMTIIDEIKGGDSGRVKFEHRIDEELDGIMTKLRIDYPEFKESDFQFLSYIIVGFDATTRSIILNESIVSMRVKKHRLLKRIQEKQTENSALYDCFLK